MAEFNASEYYTISDGSEDFMYIDATDSPHDLELKVVKTAQTGTGRLRFYADGEFTQDSSGDTVNVQDSDGSDSRDKFVVESGGSYSGYGDTGLDEVLPGGDTGNAPGSQVEGQDVQVVNRGEEALFRIENLSSGENEYSLSLKIRSR